MFTKVLTFLSILSLTSVECFTIQSNSFSSKRKHCMQDVTKSYHQQSLCFRSKLLKMSSNNEIDVEFENDDEENEIGTMRVSELKSELTLRGVDFSDCFDKESLAKKLRDARMTGKADPSIIDQFNKQRLENTFNERKVEFNDDILEKATGGDGTLPGGMPPDMLQKLMANPELMTLMQNPKMQDVMKLMMTDGAQALEKAMQDDREVYEIVTKLNAVMNNAM